MNRFDTFTIWNSASGKSDEGRESESCFEEEPDAESRANLTNDDVAGTASTTGDHAIDSAAPASWSSALRAQTFFVPMHYEANYRYPLIVWLHSDGFNENQVSHVMPHVSSRNYLATGIRASLAADASGHRFAWGSSDAAMESAKRCVLEAINRAAEQYSVHAERIILAGYHEGGSMATQIAMQHPEMFAAAVSLGGQFETDVLSQEDRQRLRNRRLPMLWQQSIQSDRFSQNRLVKEIEMAGSIGAQLEIRHYRNDDEMNTAVLSDLDRWIMNHVVSGAPVARMSKWDSSPTSFSDN